jgi:hypothetical protein
MAAAIGSIVLCVVAACSSEGTKGQGALGDQSTGPSDNPSAGVASGGRGPTGQPTVTPSNQGSSPPSSPPNSPPSSPPSSPPTTPPTRVITFRYQGDYSIVATHVCYWQVFNSGGQLQLQVGAEFRITYSGLINPTQVMFNLTNNLDGYHSEGATELGTTTHYVGGQELTSSPLAGANVKVTGTVEATDSDPTDNSATVTVSMPTVAQIGSGTHGSASC